MLVIGFAVNVSQVGFQDFMEGRGAAMEPHQSAFGFKRFFSVRALVELGKSLAQADRLWVSRSITR
jgi:flagellar biosynthesis protein FlhB